MHEGGIEQMPAPEPVPEDRDQVPDEREDDPEIQEIQAVVRELAERVAAEQGLSPEDRERGEMVGEELREVSRGWLSGVGKRTRRLVGAALLAFSAMGMALPEKAEAQPTSEATKVIAIIGGVIGVLGRGAQDVEKERERTRREQIKQQAEIEKERIKAETARQKIEAEVEKAKAKSEGDLRRDEQKLQEKLTNAKSKEEIARINSRLHIVREAIRAKEKKAVEVTAEGQTTTVNIGEAKTETPRPQSKAEDVNL